ncbi:MAG: ATP-binding protein [Burkholderiaceae bacterium]
MPSLFWRNFALIALLLMTSLATWLWLLGHAQRTPAAIRFATETASLINLTRAGLLSASDTERMLLLAMLDQDEGLRVQAAGPTDQIVAWPTDTGHQSLLQELQRRIPSARMARTVNGSEGIWVGFDIDGDPYWLVLDEARLERHQSPLIVGGWLIAATVLALLGALAISAIVQRPLRRLAQGLNAVASGAPVAALAETGPAEIVRVHRQFNQMAQELARLDQDRAVALAGISHDLRTPLTRIRLELEMAPLSDQTRGALDQDLRQIEERIGQFIDFARPESQGPWDALDLSNALTDIVNRIGRSADENPPQIELVIEPGLAWRGPQATLERIVQNLLLNAMLHGTDQEGKATLTLKAQRDGDRVRLDIQDRGPGVSSTDLERLVRPFERGDRARSGANGSGLGLAIVRQLARRHGGDLQLSLPPEGGLCARVWLRDGPRNQARV